MGGGGGLFASYRFEKAGGWLIGFYVRWRTVGCHLGFNRGLGIVELGLGTCREGGGCLNTFLVS